MLLKSKSIASLVLAFLLSSGFSGWVGYERGRAGAKTQCAQAKTEQAQATTQAIIEQKQRELAQSVQANQELQRLLDQVRHRAGVKHNEIIALKKTIAGRVQCFDDDWLRQYNSETD